MEPVPAGPSVPGDVCHPAGPFLILHRVCPRSSARKAPSGSTKSIGGRLGGEKCGGAFVGGTLSAPSVASCSRHSTTASLWTGRLRRGRSSGAVGKPSITWSTASCPTRFSSALRRVTQRPLTVCPTYRAPYLDRSDGHS
jgi:hypothetical protein